MMSPPHATVRLGAGLHRQVWDCPTSASKGTFCIPVPLMKKGESSINEIW